MVMQNRRNAGHQRLDRKDWIDIAMQTLASDSVDAVLIVPLAKKLGVTKGSFYWHFKSRDEFLQATLDDWRVKATESVIQYIEAKFEKPEAKLRELFRIAVESKYHRYEGQVELAIRDWARLDPVARKVVAEIDNLRIDYLAIQYRRLGFSGEEAKTRALLQTSFSSGNGINFGMDGDKKRDVYVKRALDIILHIA